MGSKPRSSKRPNVAPTEAARLSSSKAIDASLASLFESSLGAVKAPPQRPAAPEPLPSDSDSEDGSDSGADASESEDENRQDAERQVPSEESSSEEPSTPAPGTAKGNEPRTRKRQRDNDDLEGLYLKKLQDEEARENKKLRKEKMPKERKPKDSVDDSKSESESDDDEKVANDLPIKHEALVNSGEEELNKSQRTIFLGNVPSTAISSKADYKTLKRFFSSVGKIESVRFRSIAFSEQIPRKAAFVNHKLHEKQRTVNVYIIYKELPAARQALKLNGSVVLSRHIRVDSVAHPAKQEPRRCVFVGNLDFEAQEESLWKHFLPCGTIESVRIVRDAKTNVGKGIAYVQFEDAMSVDQALLLDGKKMQGDRKLRVTRAKAVKRSQKLADTGRQAEPKSAPRGKVFVPKEDPRQQATLGRAPKLLGKAGAAQFKQQIKVFEGLRATANTDSGIKKGGTGKKKGGSRTRAAARASAWKQRGKK